MYKNKFSLLWISSYTLQNVKCTNFSALMFLLPSLTTMALRFTDT